MSLQSINNVEANSINISNERKCEFTKEDKIIANEKKSNYSKQDLDRAINKLNKFLEDEKTHAEYSVHDTFSNRVIIKIINDETDEVIMEVPQKKILDAVAAMCKAAGVLVDKKV